MPIRRATGCSISLKRTDLPSTIENSARVQGMVVFGNLAQNTESRVELNSSSVADVTFVRPVLLQLHRVHAAAACEGAVFAHLVVKAAGVSGVQSLSFQRWDGSECRIRFSAAGPAGNREGFLHRKHSRRGRTKQ